MEVNVLGTEYTVDIIPADTDPKLEEGNDGYCDTSVKRCVIDDMSEAENDVSAKGDLKRYEIIDPAAEKS